MLGREGEDGLPLDVGADVRLVTELLGGGGLVGAGLDEQVAEGLLLDAGALAVVRGRGRRRVGGVEVLLDLGQVLLGVDEALDLRGLGGDLPEGLRLVAGDDELAAVLDLEGLADALGLRGLELERLLQFLDTAGGHWGVSPCAGCG
ncbi:hypothetical protein R2F25_38350 [Streptomyces sp. UP1A-1]|nr:hypothetical protein [Streptomyces sp. UP1A-1]